MEEGLNYLIHRIKERQISIGVQNWISSVSNWAFSQGPIGNSHFLKVGGGTISILGAWPKALVSLHFFS